MRARRAIAVVDIVESVRLMQEDEAGFIERWRQFVHAVRTEALPSHGGRLVKSLGDGMLLEFERAPQAVACVLDMLRLLGPVNEGCSDKTAIRLRSGVHAAEVTVDELDVYGAGVNLAARLATLAGPDEIVVSAIVRDTLLPGLDVELEDLGECFLKRIQTTVRAFRVCAQGRGGEATHAVGTVARAERTKPTLLVLPVWKGPSDTLAQVVADDLVSNLARCDQWIVISRLSTMALSGRALDFETIRRSLGADFVVTCSVREHAGQARIRLELAEAEHGAAVWSVGFVALAAAVFAGECSALHEAVSKISNHVVARELAASQTLALPNLDAYVLLLRGIAQSHSASHDEFYRGGQVLNHLIDRHPRAPEPRAWMAKLHILELAQGWSDNASNTVLMARDHVARALDHGPEHALALAMRAHLAFYLDRDLDSAEQGCRQALAANPNEPLAWLFLSTVHAHRADGSQALQCIANAAAISPMDPLGYYFDGFRASAELATGDYAAASQSAARSIRGNRSHVPSYLTHAIACALAGHLDAARASGRAIGELMPSFSTARYVERYPGGASEQARRFGQALSMAHAPP